MQGCRIHPTCHCGQGPARPKEPGSSTHAKDGFYWGSRGMRAVVLTNTQKQLSCAKRILLKQKNGGINQEWHITNPRGPGDHLWEENSARAAANTGHPLLCTINMKRAKYIKQRVILIDTISKVIYTYWLLLPLNYTLKTGSLSIYLFK